jgi:hypothetical protein
MRLAGYTSPRYERPKVGLNQADHDAIKPRVTFDTTMASDRDDKQKVTPVYLRSAQNVWVPALQLKTHNGKATVAVPKVKSEQDMLHCAKASKTFRYHDNETIDLKEYPNGALPLQNVDCNGNLEDHMDMVDLPFMHEVRSNSSLIALTPASLCSNLCGSPLCCAGCHSVQSQV